MALAVISAAVVILTAGYILWAIQRVYLGAEYKGPHPRSAHADDGPRVCDRARRCWRWRSCSACTRNALLNYMQPSVDKTVVQLDRVDEANTNRHRATGRQPPAPQSRASRPASRSADSLKSECMPTVNLHDLRQPADHRYSKRAPTRCSTTDAPTRACRAFLPELVLCGDDRRAAAGARCSAGATDRPVLDRARRRRRGLYSPPVRICRRRACAGACGRRRRGWKSSPACWSTTRSPSIVRLVPAGLRRAVRHPRAS